MYVGAPKLPIAGATPKLAIAGAMPKLAIAGAAKPENAGVDDDWRYVGAENVVGAENTGAKIEEEKAEKDESRSPLLKASLFVSNLENKKHKLGLGWAGLGV